MKRFVFNDQSVKNHYGFLIATSGISLQRFNGNPVMLDSHKSTTEFVLGRWINITAVDGVLSGEPVFDVAKENAKEIAGQVERDFVKGCSMGISFSREDLKLIGGVLLLEKCELMEVSIVAIPANANALALHVKEDTGERLLSDKEIQELCLSVSPEQKPEPNKIDMKIKLTLAAVAALGMETIPDEGIDSAVLSAEIVKLSSENTANKNALATLMEEKEQAQLTAVTTQVNTAIKQGKVPADKKEQFVKLGVSSPEVLTATLSAIPEKGKLPDAKAGDSNDVPMTKEAFLGLSPEAKLSFKEEHPEAYLKLFTKN